MESLMTYWCPNWTPGEDGNNGCDHFTQAISGYVEITSDGETYDSNWDRDDDAPVMCTEHDVEATDLGRTMLLQARALAYEDAGWGYCDRHEEWEEDVCTPDGDNDDRIDNVTIHTNGTFTRDGNTTHLNNGTEVRWNQFAGIYEKVRPRPTTIRSAWAPEGSAI